MSDNYCTYCGCPDDLLDEFKCLEKEVERLQRVLDAIHEQLRAIDVVAADHELYGETFVVVEKYMFERLYEITDVYPLPIIGDDDD